MGCGYGAMENTSTNLDLEPIHSYHSNGNMATESFIKDGIKEGIHREWFPDGNLQLERQYKNGELVSEKLFTIKGEVIKNIIIKDGRKYGLLFSSFCMNGIASNPSKDSLIFKSPTQ